MGITFLIDREIIQNEMAVYLREQNRHRGLDLCDAEACIRALIAAGFRGQAILSHMNDAVAVAREQVVAREMGAS